MHVVDPTDRHPVFVAAQRGDRVGGFLARIGVGPVSGQQRFGGVGRVAQRVVQGLSFGASNNAASLRQGSFSTIGTNRSYAS